MSMCLSVIMLNFWLNLYNSCIDLQIVSVLYLISPSAVSKHCLSSLSAVSLILSHTCGAQNTASCLTIKSTFWNKVSVFFNVFHQILSFLLLNIFIQSESAGLLNLVTLCPAFETNSVLSTKWQWNFVIQNKILQRSIRGVSKVVKVSYLSQCFMDSW